jgi:hypothetical protein
VQNPLTIFSQPKHAGVIKALPHSERKIPHGINSVGRNILLEQLVTFYSSIGQCFRHGYYFSEKFQGNSSIEN